MSNTTLTSHIIVKVDTGVSLLPNSTQESPLSTQVEPTENEDSTGGKEYSQFIPALSLPKSFSGSSSFISPSSSTMDTLVASETNIGVLAAEQNTHEQYKVEERATELNDHTIVPTMNPKDSADPKPIDTTIMAPSSAPASSPSTPASSSSTSIPLPTPFNSSTPTSTSASTANVNDMGVDANGLMSLLRPRPQIYHNLNVKFAPLPQLAPRKRKSSTPLGLAARSQLARRRRMMYQDSYDDDEIYEESYRPRRFNQPEISEKEGMETIDGVQENNTKKKTKKAKEGGAERKEKEVAGQSEDEDSLAALAKKMGRAGKHLWRKMSISGKAEKSDVGEDGKKLKVESVLVHRKVTNIPDEEQQGVEHRHGSVSTEEVGEQCSKSQETSRQGSAEFEPGLYEASSIPLPPSEPQSPIDAVSPMTLQPSSQETLETGMTHERASKLGEKLNDLPAMPTIVVSVA